MKFSYETADCFSYSLLKEFAKELRKNSTEAERHLWQFLRKEQLGQPFRKQHIIGCFIADFICIPSKLVVELDGGYHSLPQQQISDVQRTQWLESEGYRVIRFTNEQVLFDLDNVLLTIKQNLK